MSFLDTLKELAGTVVEAVKENPVAAAAIGGGVLVVGGGSIYAKRRYAAHKAAKAVAPAVAAPVAAVEGITPVAAAEEPQAPAETTLLNEQNQFPDRQQLVGKG